MTELLRLALDVWRYIWPFRIVAPWGRGVYFVWGHYWRTVGPGIWPVLPYFTNLTAVSVVPAIYSTPLQTVTANDGQTLAFSASITTVVENAAQALNSVDQYHETTIELVSGLLAEELAKLNGIELAQNRSAIIESLRLACDNETSKFGVRVTALRFPSLAFVRTLRILTERATLNQDGKP